MTNKNPKSKHQHWVPQFYLRNFALREFAVRRDYKVWVLDKSLSIPSAPTAVHKVAGKHHLYSPKDKHGVRDWTADDFIERIETDASLLWPAFISEMQFDNSEKSRATLARFIGSLHLRNLAVYKNIFGIIDSRTKLYGPLSEDKISQLKPNAPDPTNAGRFFATMLMNDDAKMTQMFYEPHWIILDSQEDVFVTSDRPVIFLRGGGPGKPESIVCLPLSPRRVLMMLGDKLDRGISYGSLPADLNLTVNRHLFEKCLLHTFTGRPVGDVVSELRA